MTGSNKLLITFVIHYFVEKWFLVVFFNCIKWFRKNWLRFFSAYLDWLIWCKAKEKKCDVLPI